MNPIDKKIIKGALSYEDYHRFMAELVSHQQTEDYSEEYINYTRMNIIRMERLDKTTRLQEPLISTFKELPALYLLTLTEPWCGDAAQVLPVVNKFVAHNSKVSLGMIMRDKNLTIMDAFLTEGSRSIPKIIVLNPGDHTVLGAWGPRPYVAHGMINRGLAEWRQMPEGQEKVLFRRDLMTRLQKWYARDKTSSIQEEFINYLQGIKKPAE